VINWVNIYWVRKCNKDIKDSPLSPSFLSLRDLRWWRRMMMRKKHNNCRFCYFKHFSFIFMELEILRAALKSQNIFRIFHLRNIFYFSFLPSNWSFSSVPAEQFRFYNRSPRLRNSLTFNWRTWRVLKIKQIVVERWVALRMCSWIDCVYRLRHRCKSFFFFLLFL
jgi:hypothetical protein